MAVTPTKRAQIAARRADVAERYLRGQSMRKIGLALGVNVATVHSDIEACRAEWRERRISATDEQIVTELAKLDELERTYWEAWERSLTPRNHTSQRQVNTQGGVTRIGAGVSYAVQTQTVERDGNPAYLGGVERCIERRCKLLGLDAPERREITGKDGGPVEAAVLDLAALSDEELAALYAIVNRHTA